jgi:hypothetical protein
MGIAHLQLKQPYACRCFQAARQGKMSALGIGAERRQGQGGEIKETY